MIYELIVLSIWLHADANLLLAPGVSIDITPKIVLFTGRWQRDRKQILEEAYLTRTTTFSTEDNFIHRHTGPLLLSSNQLRI